jgi:hypothetical protein
MDVALNSRLKMLHGMSVIDPKNNDPAFVTTRDQEEISPVLLIDGHAQVCIVLGFSKGETPDHFIELNFRNRLEVFERLGGCEINHTQHIIIQMLKVPGALVNFLHIPPEHSGLGTAGLQRMLAYASEVASRTKHEYWPDIWAIRCAGNPDLVKRLYIEA